MNYKKPVALAAAGLTLMSAPLHAGGMAEPMMEPEIIVEESSASSGGFIVPLILLALLVAVASSSSGGTPTEG
jgi:hypothetical protein